MIDEEKIRLMAREIYQQQKLWDDLVWLYAESELRLAPAYASGADSQPNHLFTVKVIEIDPSKIVDYPIESDIRRLAEQFAAQRPSVQDLHWYIAERMFVYNVVKNNEK